MQNQLDEAVRVVRTGGVIAYPTESCYGLGCDPGNKVAINRILALKSRSKLKGLILVADQPQKFNPYIVWPEEPLYGQILASWPGPITWLLPKQATVTSLLSGQHLTLAVRVSAHPLVRALCGQMENPLVSTSANPEGKNPAKTAGEVAAYFEPDIDFVVQGTIGASDRPSQIVDASSGKVIRE